MRNSNGTSAFTAVTAPSGTIVGTTDKEFSAHSGVSASTVSRLRSGERGMDIETAVKIARGLGRSVDWLLTGEEERRPRIFTFTETSLETIRDALDIAIEDAKARKGRED